MELKEQLSPLPLISGYGEGGFRISGIRHEGNILICAHGHQAWNLKSEKNITKQSLKYVFKGDFPPEFLVFGLGKTVENAVLLSKEYEKKFGLPIEVMSSGAAVRTYNILVLEGRKFAAAILAI